jgi:hypothetical protein
MFHINFGRIFAYRERFSETHKSKKRHKVVKQFLYLPRPDTLFFEITETFNFNFPKFKNLHFRIILVLKGTGTWSETRICAPPISCHGDTQNRFIFYIFEQQKIARISSGKHNFKEMCGKILFHNKVFK